MAYRILIGGVSEGTCCRLFVFNLHKEPIGQRTATARLPVSNILHPASSTRPLETPGFIDPSSATDGSRSELTVIDVHSDCGICEPVAAMLRVSQIAHAGKMSSGLLSRLHCACCYMVKRMLPATGKPTEWLVSCQKR
ncbi:MAG: hypothetical protein CMJ81_14300 [Planctomycetaceae bacterium]|nr:hypothetical protein [Planctomycetaceae bacterium]MBP60978.1 hypothetical protein [Planctomycetaceae bacterium]